MDYEVSKRTLAVIPNGNRRCKVLEERATYNINKTSFKVIEHSCEYFGVSYQSRLKGSQKFIKSRYKTPILVEETSRLVFIPVSSTTRGNTLWINYNNIKDFYPSKNKKKITIIRFMNGYKMEVPVSYYSFNNQFLKASRLSAVVSDRFTRNN